MTPNAPPHPGPAPTAVRGRIDGRQRRRALAPGLASLLAAGGAWALTLAAVAAAPWWAKPLFGLANGLAVGVLFIVGHDACHGTLLPRRWQNRLAGRLALLPALHPYTAWKHNHNGLHHAFTNIKEKDPGFPPLSPAEYAALPGWRKRLYRVNRTWYGLGLLYFTEMWVKWEFFPTPERAPRDPAAFRRDRRLCAAFAAGWVGLLVWAGGTWAEAAGLAVVGFVLPQATWQWLIAFIIFQHHTHPRVAWYSALDAPAAPTFFHSQVRATPHLIFPGPLRWLMRHVMEHTAHHADPAVPLYRLTDAQAALDKAYRADILRVHWSPRSFLETMRVCKLYDYAAHRWVGFDGTPLSPPLLARPAGG